MVNRYMVVDRKNILKMPRFSDEIDTTCTYVINRVCDIFHGVVWHDERLDCTK